MPKHIESQDHQIGQNKSIDLTNKTTIADVRAEIGDIEIVKGGDNPHFKQHADNLAFMEEIVSVVVHQSADPNAEKIVFVSNDGKPQRFIRGMEQKVKRKYVEVLARAKTGSVSTPEATDPDGNRFNKIEQQTALVYPFAVIEDKNPRGRAWLESVLREA